MCNRRYMQCMKWVSGHWEDHFPCNVTFETNTVGIGSCPKSLEIHVPIFTPTTFQLVPWKLINKDDLILKLHHHSLNIPPPVKWNRSIIGKLDETYTRLDQQFAVQMLKVKKDIDKIGEFEDSPILLYTTLCLSILNSLCIILCCILYKAYRTKRNTPPPTTVILQELERKEDINRRDSEPRTITPPASPEPQPKAEPAVEPTSCITHEMTPCSQCDKPIAQSSPEPAFVWPKYRQLRTFVSFWNRQKQTDATIFFLCIHLISIMTLFFTFKEKEGKPQVDKTRILHHTPGRIRQAS